VSAHNGFIRVVIVDEEAMFRDALRRVIDAEPGMRVVGEAAGRADAVDLTRRHQPDVVLLDFSAGEATPEIVRSLHTAGGNKTRVIVLTGEGSGTYAVPALEIGAHGVVAKDSPTAVLFDSIRTVARGQYWLRDAHVAEVVHAIRQLGSNGRSRSPFRLTPREMEIVSYVADGYSNKDIAARCQVREDTVKHHLSSIFAKVGVRSRLELAMFAVQHGLVRPAEERA
jgi:DNA-binding NarL/FixJ family response regulator